MKKEVDMEPIFTVKCKCTEKEYFRFYRYLLFKRYKWLSYLSLLFITALVVSFIVTSLLGGLIDWKSSLSPMACFLFYFLCIFYILPYSAVRRFRKNKLARDLESEISFFEDHIETVNKYENFTCLREDGQNSGDKDQRLYHDSAELGFDPAETGLPGRRPGVHPSSHEAA